MRYISRSSHETSSRCKRKGYYNYLYRGKGLQEASTPIPLAIGLATHKGVETLLGPEPDLAIDAALIELQSAAPELDRMDPRWFQWEEAQALVEGMLRAWNRVRLPALLEEYEVITLEQETPMLLAPFLTLQARADAVVRSRDDGRVYVFNWKTTNAKANWQQKWEKDIQAITEALATEQAIGEPVAGVIFEGLYKTDTRNGITPSPLIYGYKKGELWNAGYKAGWERQPIWKLHEGALQWWINWMSEETLAEQFVRTTPILQNRAVVEDWLEQVVQAETANEHVLTTGTERDKELHFQQEFSSWNCNFCPFYRACWKQMTIEDMLEQGMLRERIDHHNENPNNG